MEKLTAPKLPKGYRFKVTMAGDPRFNRVALQKKWLIFWDELAVCWSYPCKEEIYSQMNKLLAILDNKTTQFTGCYPPREEL